MVTPLKHGALSHLFQMGSHAYTTAGTVSYCDFFLDELPPPSRSACVIVYLPLFAAGGRSPINHHQPPTHEYQGRVHNSGYVGLAGQRNNGGASTTNGRAGARQPVSHLLIRLVLKGRARGLCLVAAFFCRCRCPFVWFLRVGLGAFVWWLPFFADTDATKRFCCLCYELPPYVLFTHVCSDAWARDTPDIDKQMVLSKTSPPTDATAATSAERQQCQHKVVPLQRSSGSYLRDGRGRGVSPVASAHSSLRNSAPYGCHGGGKQRDRHGVKEARAATGECQPGRRSVTRMYD